MSRTLQQLLEVSAARRAKHPAVEDPERDASVTYEELHDLSDGLKDILAGCGVRPGDRVGICAPKSIGTVASIFGILKAGGAYVPVDYSAPAARNASIFEDCSVRAIIAARDRVEGLVEALGDPSLQPGVELEQLKRLGVDLVVIERPGDGATAAADAPLENLAYILYTSGSTGKPKGVIHTHDSALSFVDWCSSALEPNEDDRFSSHAPFHFDLSILDLYVPLKHGGTVVLFGEELGKLPPRLASVIADRRISVWYSTPSVLRLLVEYGQLGKYDWSALRTVLFAGEVFPIKYLQALKEAWPEPRYFNLYGPTETNVCTYFEVPAVIPDQREAPFPIGVTCENDRSKVVDEHGKQVAVGEEGELLVSGGSVMVGYWNLPERTAVAFDVDADGTSWYRTGDIVKEMPDGNFDFLGRRDRMVKRRGYRVELGEIESALYRHPAVAEAAAVALPDKDGGVLIKAYLSYSGDEAPSMIELKSYCARNLPLYMVPDRFSFRDALPKTSTDKIDYQTLKSLG